MVEQNSRSMNQEPTVLDPIILLATLAGAAAIVTTFWRESISWKLAFLASTSLIVCVCIGPVLITYHSPITWANILLKVTAFVGPIILFGLINHKMRQIDTLWFGCLVLTVGITNFLPTFGLTLSSQWNITLGMYAEPLVWLIVAFLLGTFIRGSRWALRL